MGPETNRGRIGPLTLLLHGTKDRPHYANWSPRKYNDVEKIPDENLHLDYDEFSNEIFDEFDDNGISPLWTRPTAESDNGLDDLPDDYWMEEDFDEDKVLDRVHHQNFGNDVDYSSDEALRTLFDIERQKL